MAQNWQTKLIHSSAKVPEGFRALSVPVERASTVVFADCESAVGGWDVEANGYTYGIHGTPAPGEIGHAESHGCIRLTNWDASELASMVKPGTPAVLAE